LLLILQYVLVVVLVGVLAASVVLFGVLGAARVRRTRRLARRAHQRGMRFFRDDPFDVPRRYAAFAAISCGHSPRASNVVDMRLDGIPVRSFDFHCELGHGTRRTARRFGVVVAETELPGGRAVLWHEADGDLSPLAARGGPGARRVGPWACSGSPRLVEALAAAAAELAPRGASLEVAAAGLLVCVPVGPWGRGAQLDAQDVLGVLRALRQGGVAGVGTA